MPARQPVDFLQCSINPLRVKRFASLKECILITKITMMGAPAGNNNGIRDQVKITFDQITTDGRNVFNISFCIYIEFLDVHKIRGIIRILEILCHNKLHFF